MPKVEALIRMYTCDACILTTREYEELLREVQSRVIAGANGVGDRILARLLYEHGPRYGEAKMQNEREG